MNNFLSVSGGNAAVFIQKCIINAPSANFLSGSGLSSVHIANCDINCGSLINVDKLETINIHQINFRSINGDSLPYSWWERWFDVFKWNGFNSKTLTYYYQHIEAAEIPDGESRLSFIAEIIDNCSTKVDFHIFMKMLFGCN